MTLKKRALLISTLLDRYVPHPEPALFHNDPFTLLVAVCLSAQCTDARVNLITPKLFEVAPNAFMMATMDINVLEEIIRPCGLAPSKARRLLALAHQLVNRHQGQVPCDLKALEALDGVGHKTASVVLSQAFNKPAFAIDTHILRSALRWKLSTYCYVEGVEKDLKKLFAKKVWSKTHLQIVLYARKYCPARGHIIEKCPICQALNDFDALKS